MQNPLDALMEELGVPAAATMAPAPLAAGAGELKDYMKGGGEVGEAFREGIQSQIQRAKASHDNIVDMMIAHPEMTKGEIAQKLGFSRSYLSIVTGSDAFKVRLAARRAQFIDPIVQASVTEMFGAMTERAVEILTEKLSAPTSTIDPQLALQAASLGAKVAGLGGFGAKTAVINVAPSEERLNRLADNLTRLAGGLGAEASGARKAADSTLASGTLVADAIVVESRG